MLEEEQSSQYNAYSSWGESISFSNSNLSTWVERYERELDKTAQSKALEDMRSTSFDGNSKFHEIVVVHKILLASSDYLKIKL